MKLKSFAESQKSVVPPKAPAGEKALISPKGTISPKITFSPKVGSPPAAQSGEEEFDFKELENEDQR